MGGKFGPPYNFKIEHRSGKTNKNADGLSRQFQSSDDAKPSVSESKICPSLVGSSELPVDLHCTILKDGVQLNTDRVEYAYCSHTLAFPSYADQEMRQLQQKDPDISFYAHHFIHDPGQKMSVSKSQFVKRAV